MGDPSWAPWWNHGVLLRRVLFIALGAMASPPRLPPLLESVMPQPSDSWDPLGTGQEGRPVQKPGSGQYWGVCGTKELYPGFIKQPFSHPASSCHGN